MSLPQHFMDELRRRTVLSEIIGKRVNLTKKSGSFVGLCPFHNEKTPSFHVRDDKGYYHCFGCGASGDAIAFLREKEALEFMEAVQLLADMAGMTVPRQEARNPEAEAKRTAGIALLEEAARFFNATLLDDIAKQGPIAAYLEQRGLGADAIETFQLGYAPRKGFSEAMTAAGYSVEDQIESGLMRRSERDSSVFAYFRHRLIFPIMDSRARVIAFGGRALDDGQQPKYLNSAENPLFHKKMVLYGEHLAKTRLREKLPLVIAEGYMDTIAVHLSGTAAAVAPLGTAMTEEQIKQAWRMHDNPVLCFDGDAAGKTAALRAVLRALTILETGKSLRFMALPINADPDDVLRQQGIDAFNAMLNNTTPMVDVLWQGIKDKYTLDDVASRTKFWQEIRQYIREINNHQMRAALGDEIEARIAAMRDEVRGYSARGGAGRGFARIRPNINRPSLSSDDRQRLIVALLLMHPQLIGENHEEIMNLQFSESLMIDQKLIKVEKLRQAVINAFGQSAELDKLSLRVHLEEHGFGSETQRDLLEELLENLLKGIEMRLHRLGYDMTAISIEQAQKLLKEMIATASRTRKPKKAAPMKSSNEIA